MYWEKKTIEYKDVVIYCRVSSKKQVREGNGLDSQEAKCRTWCKSKNLNVLKVFREEGISGGKKDRPALMEMFSFLAEISRKKIRSIVLVEDLSRWSRETVNHFELKRVIVELGHMLQSVNMHLEDTEYSEFMETITASVGQLHRKQNAKRAKSCMVEQAKLGYWIMTPPTGYLAKRINGKIYCYRNEPTATYVQNALEGFADGRFLTQKDIYDYLKRCELIGYHGKPINVTLDFVKNMLTNEKYTGYFSYENWNIPYQKWAMDEIISRETYQKIQDKLNGKKNALKPRKYNMNDEDFPLRRWLKCAVCGHDLTGSKARSRSGTRHPYYHCHNKECPKYGKGIRQHDLHEDFTNLLSSFTPPSGIINLANAIIQDKISTESKQQKEDIKSKQKEIKKKQEEKQKCFELLLNSSREPEIANMCKAKITELEQEIKQLSDETDNKENLLTQSLAKKIEETLEFIKRPALVWKVGNYKQRRAVLNLCFAEPISYDNDKKFGTPKFSSIFSVFNNFSSENTNWWSWSY